VTIWGFIESRRNVQTGLEIHRDFFAKGSGVLTARDTATTV
jgi:hypothetical protein